MIGYDDWSRTSRATVESVSGRRYHYAVRTTHLSPNPHSEKTQDVIGSVDEDKLARDKSLRPVTPPNTLAAVPLLSSRLAAQTMVLESSAKLTSSGYFFGFTLQDIGCSHSQSSS